MKKSTQTIVYIAITVILALSSKTLASTFTYKGKEISKGEAVKILIKDPNAQVIKSDLVEFSDKSGGLKNRKAVKK